MRQLDQSRRPGAAKAENDNLQIAKNRLPARAERQSLAIEPPPPRLSLD